MKSTTAAASTFLSLAAAQGGPPGGWSGHGGPPGAFGAFPSCVSSCWSDVQSSCSSASDYSCFCSGDTVSSANSCIADSDCSDSEKDQTYQAIAQMCANAGASVTAKPEATWSATSGGSSWPSGWTTATSWPSGGPWAGHGGPPGGGWAGGAGGWGPFGHGDGHGWGPWSSISTGSWTNGPWTSWWGGDACPPSTWSGWTSASWATDAPWTTWSGCAASTTATNVVTTSYSSGGSLVTSTSTDFGIQVAQATNSGGSSSSSSGAAPQATGNVKLAGSAAGAMGVLAGALLL